MTVTEIERFISYNNNNKKNDKFNVLHAKATRTRYNPLSTDY